MSLNLSNTFKQFFFSNRQTIRVMFCMEMLVEIISRPYIVFQQTQFVNHFLPILSNDNCCGKSFTTHFVNWQSNLVSITKYDCRATIVVVSHLPPDLSIDNCSGKSFTSCFVNWQSNLVSITKYDCRATICDWLPYYKIQWNRYYIPNLLYSCQSGSAKRIRN